MLSDSEVKDPPQPALHVHEHCMHIICTDIIFCTVLEVSGHNKSDYIQQILSRIAQRVESPRAESRGWNCEGRIADGRIADGRIAEEQIESKRFCQ